MEMQVESGDEEDDHENDDDDGDGDDLKGGKEHSLLIIWSAQDLVVQQVELVADTESGGFHHQWSELAPWFYFWKKTIIIIINATYHMRSPVTTLLAGEALEVINICPGSHHHLKSRDHLLT